MNAEELLAAFPGAKTAVAYTEAIICGRDGTEQSCWDLMMSVDPPLPPEGVLSLIRSAMEGETACKAEEALAQTYHPDYRCYLMGKLGLA